MTVNAVAGVVPKVTAVAPARFVPAINTVVPPAGSPRCGEMPATVGGATEHIENCSRAIHDSVAPLGSMPIPTIVFPSPEIATALVNVHPAVLIPPHEPRMVWTDCIPIVEVQTHARLPAPAEPTTTEPSELTPLAMLEHASPWHTPGKKLRNEGVPLIQIVASPLRKPSLFPTTTEPSAFTPYATPQKPPEHGAWRIAGVPFVQMVGPKEPSNTYDSPTITEPLEFTASAWA